MAVNKRYQELASKWLSGTITDEEKREFSAWYNAHPDDRVVLPESFAANEEALRIRILANIQPEKVHRFQLRRSIVTAATITIAVVVGLLLWKIRAGHDALDQMAIQQDVQPGGNKATLTLTDGRVIDLRNDKAEIIVGADIRYGDGSLVTSTHEPLVLTTPKGGQYQLILPDGTKVWLNSGSSLKYPAKFEEEERLVELVCGEAYFEVATQLAKDGSNRKRPFIVKTRQQEVEVLGTQFNINAYADEVGITTTLVEGAVNIHHPGGNTRGVTRLVPGEQAQLAGNSISVQKINSEEYTAWKEGYFYFNNADVYAMGKQLERWYDIDVIYKVTASDDLFVGKIPRHLSLASTLNVLRSAGVRFKIEGRTLSVLPAK